MDIESRWLWFGRDYPAGIVTDLHHPVSFSQEVQLICSGSNCPNPRQWTLLMGRIKGSPSPVSAVPLFLSWPDKGRLWYVRHHLCQHYETSDVQVSRLDRERQNILVFVGLFVPPTLGFKIAMIENPWHKRCTDCWHTAIEIYTIKAGEIKENHTIRSVIQSSEKNKIKSASEVCQGTGAKATCQRGKLIWSYSK